MSSTHTVSARTYVVIWGWLAGLMLLSVLLSGLPISASTAAWLVLILSTVKALLVSLYYMHLKFDRRLLALVLLAPVVLVLLAVGLLYSSTLVRL